MKRNGFTIIELVFVIALVGLIGLAALTISPSTSPTNVISAARRVQSDLEYARQNAMMTGTNSGITFVANSIYTVYQGTVLTPLISPLTQTALIITLSSDFPNVRVNNTYTAEFNAMGTPALGGGGSVTITDGTTSKIVSVTANTGLVTIQ